MVVYDRNAEAITELAKEGSEAADSLEDMRAKFDFPASFWVILPAGGPTDDTIEAPSGLCGTAM